MDTFNAEISVFVQAKIGSLNDPLLSQRRCRTAEVGAIYRCETGTRLRSADVERLQLPQLPLRPAGRHGTDWPVWQAMHVNDIESAARQACRLAALIVWLSVRSICRCVWSDATLVNLRSHRNV